MKAACSGKDTNRMASRRRNIFQAREHKRQRQSFRLEKRSLGVLGVLP